MNVLEFLSSILAIISWPITLFSIAWIFCKSIISLLDRLNQAEALGVKISMQASTSIDSLLLENPSSNPLTISYESGARERVKTAVRQQLEIIDATKKQEALVEAVAIERLDKHLAIVYANIFNSQISLLQSLIASNGAIAKEKAVRDFEEFKEQNQVSRDSTFDMFIGYMERQLLVDVNHESLSITDIGCEFFVFLSRYGLSFSRPV